MSEILPASVAREHLRIGANVTDEVLTPYVAAAIGRIEDFLGRPLLGEGGWNDADAVPPLVKHAAKLALADFYINREVPELTDDQLRPIIGRYLVISVG